MRRRFLAVLLVLSVPLFCVDSLAQQISSDQPTAPLRERLRVFFAHNSSELGADGLETVRRAATTAQTLNLLSINVVGHADRIGSAVDNVRLAQERAEHVTAALRAAQVPESVIGAPESRGANEPLTTNKKELHLNRRVEISIYGVPRLETGVPQ